MTRFVMKVVAAAALAAFVSPVQAHTVTAYRLNVRSGPGTGYRILGSLTRGTVVNVVRYSGSWREINSPRWGWVYGAYLANTSHTAVSSGSDFTWPVTGRVTTTWYNRRSYGYHGAIDIGAPYWRAVGPARSGTVSFRGWSGGYGNLVIVRHSGSYTTYYAHNIRFGSGGWVTRAHNISYIGSTGNSTGPHCHFEIRRYGTKRYIPSWLGQTVYRGRAVAYNYAGI